MKLLLQVRKSSSGSWHSFQVNVQPYVFCLFCVFKIWKWTSDKMLIPIPIPIKLVINLYSVSWTFIDVVFFWTQICFNITMKLDEIWMGNYFLLNSKIWTWSPFRKLFLWTCSIFVFCKCTSPNYLPSVL